LVKAAVAAKTRTSDLIHDGQGVTRVEPQNAPPKRAIVRRRSTSINQARVQDDQRRHATAATAPAEVRTRLSCWLPWFSSLSEALPLELAPSSVTQRECKARRASTAPRRCHGAAVAHLLRADTIFSHGTSLWATGWGRIVRLWRKAQDRHASQVPMPIPLP
jgi:hypothetical protein